MNDTVVEEIVLATNYSPPPGMMASLVSTRPIFAFVAETLTDMEHTIRGIWYLSHSAIF